jgi:hypothetical protein
MGIGPEIESNDVAIWQRLYETVVHGTERKTDHA